MFVLLTTIHDGRALSDRKVLENYKRQSVVEVGFHWLKGPLAVVPVFLKSPKRIEVLGFVYLIAILTYGLIQRDIRSRLKKRGRKLPHPDRRRTALPTTQGILKVFENVEHLVICGGTTEESVLRIFSSDHYEILELLELKHLYSKNSFDDL
jgi:transposase